MPNRVYLFDTTLRDGEQSPGCSMTKAEKLEMAGHLVELGVDILEAGFPIAIGIVNEPSIGVDTPEDYRRFVERWQATQTGSA